MDPTTADLLLTLAASTSLVALGVLSVAVLPWSRRDLRASVAAWRALGALGLHTVRALASQGQAAPIPVQAEPATTAPDLW